MNPSHTFKCISSMATRQWLAAACEQWPQAGGQPVTLVSLGGVDAARRIEAGEVFDVAVLAADALQTLAVADRVGAVAPVANSVVAVAAAAGHKPPIATVAELLDTLGAARAIGYSTGPSGKALLALLAGWGVLEGLQSRLVQAPAGVPVGRLLANGDVDIGFQQLSELVHCQGITLLGAMPPGAEINTVFSAAACHAGHQPEAAAAFIAYLRSAACAGVIRRDGMEPAGAG